jgi:hypothetical protein
MPKTIDDLHALLTGHGYICERPLDMIVATTITTQVYKSPAGEKALEILLTFDNANACVAIEILHAFDLKKAAHREATLACLMTASARTPLLRPTLEPEGDIRLRIDCTCGSEGARDEDVLRALLLLPCFADAWHEQITMAMEKGKFDANKVAYINLSQTRGLGSEPGSSLGSSLGSDRGRDPESQQPPAATEPTGSAHPPEAEGGANAADLLRAAAISQKPGGHVNRLQVLEAFRRWLDDQNRNTGNQN